MAARKNITIKNAVLCEDIRQEKSNKYILLGVFGGNIIVGKLPASIPLAVYVEGTTKQPVARLKFRLSGPGEGSGIMGLDFKRIEGVTGEDFAIASPRLEVLMEQEGTFKIEWSEGDDNWRPLIEKKVTQQEGIWALSPIASEQPSEQSPPDAPES